jgi:BirA family biotin operon repressor/biotin-[acetyl-CoA-carboxylase] ligase
LTCIFADTQTHARGRNNRPWHAPKGNLYLSLFFTIPSNNTYLPNVGQLLSLICAELFSLSIKWPNDLVIGPKKIGGVLTEALMFGDKIQVIIGLGLNVNMTADALSPINREATSLLLLKGKKFDIEELVHTIASSFATKLPHLQTQGFSIFYRNFQKHLAYMGEKISFHLGAKKIEGICEGITEDGRLKFRDASSNIVTFISGEIG